MPFFNIVKANLEIKSLSEKMSALNTKVEELVSENKSLKEANENLVQTQAAFSLGSQGWMDEKEALLKTHKEELDMLNSKLSIVQTSATAEASALVASLGIEAESIKPTVAEITEVSSLDIAIKHNELVKTDPDAAETFYEKNRKVLKEFHRL